MNPERSPRIPKKILGANGRDPREILEVAGFVFADKAIEITIPEEGVVLLDNHSEDDELEITLPEGWRIQRNAISAKYKKAGVPDWILDQKGRIRASINYRHKCLILQQRFDLESDEEDGHPYVSVTDCDKPFKRFQGYGSAIAHLDNEYPGWNDPTAYWD